MYDCLLYIEGYILLLQVHSSGAVLRLAQPCPWKEHLFDLEQSLNISGTIKFVLYKEDNSEKWRVQVRNTQREMLINQAIFYKIIKESLIVILSNIVGCPRARL